MDNLDMKILSKLLNNCRESDRQIGMELGISGGAVRARIKKMEKNFNIGGCMQNLLNIVTLSTVD